MGFLLDTNVISAMRRPDQLDPAARDVIVRLSHQDTFLCVVTVMEIEMGILRIARRDPRQSDVLRRWSLRIMREMAGRIIDVDADIATCCATLHVPDRRSYQDAWLAATALVRGLTLVTRNVSDYAGTGVPILDPWNA